MSFDLNPEDKEVRERNENYFRFGIHKVKFMLIEADTGANGKNFMEVSYCALDNPDIEDTARLYFVGGASNISFNTLRDIYVHNAPEDKKIEAGATFDEVKNADDIVKLLNDKIGGVGEMWMTKYYDPKRTYVDARGVTRRSINKDVLGYEPKLKPELMPVEKTADNGNINANDFDPAEEPFKSNNGASGTPVTDEEQAQIPKSW